MDGICYIVGSRPPGEIALARGREALVIAADGGLRHLEAQGLTADLIVGDFDSLGRVPEGDNILRHPVEKDDTDMLLAVRTGLDRGYRVFVLYGGLGGRLDHTYANLQAKPTVEPGELVTAGQIIGAVGTTASAEAAQSPHLHFSVTRNGEAIDPAGYLDYSE